MRSQCSNLLSVSVCRLVLSCLLRLLAALLVRHHRRYQLRPLRTLLSADDSNRHRRQMPNAVRSGFSQTLTASTYSQPRLVPVMKKQLLALLSLAPPPLSVALHSLSPGRPSSLSMAPQCTETSSWSACRFSLECWQAESVRT